MEYKRYEKYKDSGIEWIREIPESWNVSKIRYSSYVKGRIGWQGLRAEEFIDEGPYLVTGTDFVKGIVNWESCYHISEQRFQEAPQIQLKDGDLLITKDGTIGKLAYIEKLPDKASLNSHLLVIRPLNKAYITKFMFWMFNSYCFKQYVNMNQTGTTFYGITQEKIEDFSFQCPQIETQEKIVNFLDYKTSEIDDLITDKEKLIELLQEQRQAIINEAVTKGLNRDVKMKDSGIEWIGQIPNHWEVLPLKFLVSNPITDGPHETPQIYEEGIPFVSAEACSSGEINFDKIRGYITIEDHKRYSKKYKPQKNDIFMIKSGATTGVTAIVETEQEFNIWSPLAVIRTNEKYYPLYVLNCMRSQSFQDSVVLHWNYGTQQNIGMGTIANLPIACPPIEEQKNIAQVLDYKTLEINLLIDDIKKNIEFLRTYRQSIISEVVTGKIDVRDWTA